MAAMISVLSQDELSGNINDKYRIVRKLGEGGMARVYEATHTRLERRVAIKVLRSDLSHSECAAQRLTREARIMAQLQSPHVVQVLDVDTLESGCPFVVMECLEGENLLTTVEREGSLSLLRTLELARQVCAGLSEAHSRGIVHRDLKPENLHLSRSREGGDLIKILDFGISKLRSPGVSRLTREHVALGSPQYMAPEQLTSTGSVDERADIWSLGIVLYELATGNVPFDADSLAELYTHILKAEAVPPSAHRSTLPPEFDALVLACLEKDADLRPQTVAELAHRLESCLETAKQQATSEPSTSTPTLRVGEHRLSGIETAPSLTMTRIQHIQRKRYSQLGLSLAGTLAAVLLLTWHGLATPTPPATSATPGPFGAEIDAPTSEAGIKPAAGTSRTASPQATQIPATKAAPPVAKPSSVAPGVASGPTHPVVLPPPAPKQRPRPQLKPVFVPATAPVLPATLHPLKRPLQTSASRAQSSVSATPGVLEVPNFGGRR